jgi:hypothetical protein
MNLIEARDITDIDARVVEEPSGYFNLKHQDSMRASSLRPTAGRTGFNRRYPKLGLAA